MFSKCQFLVRDVMLIFCGIPHGVPVNSEYSRELCRTMNDVSLCGHLPHFRSSKIWSPNIELSFHWTLLLPKSFLHCHCVRRTDFAPKYASMTFICCCLVQHPVRSILVSKESPRLTLCTTWKIWKKSCKTQFGKGRFLGGTLYVMANLNSDKRHKHN